jgi:hypothetical protein
MLINASPEARGFQLPQPQFRWRLRLDTASGAMIDREIDRPQLEVAPHSLQLLTALVEAPSPASGVHSVSDTAVQPGMIRRPEPGSS